MPDPTPVVPATLIPTLGADAVIKIGSWHATVPVAASSATKLSGLTSWSTEAPATIDVTVSGDSHSRSIVGLRSGTISAEIIDDGQAILATALTNGLDNKPSYCYFYLDGGTTPVASWYAIVSGTLSSGGPGAATTRQLTFHRQCDVNPSTGEKV